MDTSADKTGSPAIAAATMEPSVRAAALNGRAWELREADPRQAMELAAHALTLARECRCDRDEADALRTCAFLRVHRGEYADAVKEAAEAYDIYTSLDDQRGMAASLMITGRARQSQGDHPDALALHQQARKLAVAAGDRRLEAEILEYSADVSHAAGKEKQAVALYREGLALRETLGDERGKATLLRKLALKDRGPDDPRSGIEYLEESLAICERIGDFSGQYKTLNNLGLIYLHDQHQYAKALDCFTRSIEAIRKVGDILNEATSLSNMGAVYRQVGDFARAAECHSLSLAIAEQIGDQQATARALVALGNIWYETQEYAAALDYYGRARTIYEEVGDWQNEVLALRNIANAHHRRGDYHESLQCLHKARGVRHNAGDTADHAAFETDLGDAYAGLDDFAASIEHYRKGVALAEQHGAKRTWTDALLGLGSVLLRMGKSTEAIGHLETALGIATDIQTPKFIAHAHERLADAYEATGDLARAVHHLRACQQARDQMFSEASARTVKGLLVQHDIEAVKRQATATMERNEQLTGETTELEDLVRQKDELIERCARLMGVAAHDLRGPLMRIRLASSIGPAEDASAGALRAKLAEVDTIAGQMLRLVGNLLSREAIEAGRFDLHPERVDLAALARGIAGQHRDAARRKRIAIEVTTDCATAEAMVDRQAFQQVLDNLVSNAIKFSPEGGTIRIGACADGPHARCTVQDEGPGISETDRKKLFSAFGRLTAKPTGGETSTGLGLWIVKALAEAMGGTVQCESIPGHGATFVVEVPKA